VSRVGTLAADDLDEASGLIESPSHPGVFWTHNDGNDGFLYAVRRGGSFVARFKLGVKVRDWEDLARDEAGRIYVADTGNNAHDRETVSIFQLAEPDPAGEKRELTPLRRWRISFPKSPLNSEALVVRDGYGYLISKLEDGHRAKMYRFALSQERKAELEQVATLAITEPVTSADISTDGNRLAVLARGALYVFEINGAPASAQEAQPQRITIPPIQAEGCCFVEDGVLLVAESREILLVRIAPATRPVATQPATSAAAPAETSR